MGFTIYVYSILSFSGLLILLAAGLMIAERYLVTYGICKVDINAGEKPLEVEGGQTLLSSLYANEIFIPSACGGKLKRRCSLARKFAPVCVWPVRLRCEKTYMFVSPPISSTSECSQLRSRAPGRSRTISRN